MRWELNGKRRVMIYEGDVREVEECDKFDWHLIRHGVSVSMSKTEGETFVQFCNRMLINSKCVWEDNNYASAGR